MADIDATMDGVEEAEPIEEETEVRRKALIVGINDYPTAPLSGCVPDGNQNASELVRNYAFHSHDVRLLFNGRATTKNILERLRWLVFAAKPGDILFFAYSGHGAQVPCRGDAGEMDDLNECICPVDFDWSPERMILDKQFVKIFSQLPKGVKLFWLNDSCHSGDLNRGIPKNSRKRVPRAFPIPRDVEWSIRAAKSKGCVSSSIKAFINGQLEVAFAPGCKSNQTSADTEIDGNPCGALTHYFWDAVHKLPKDATVQRIVDYTRTSLTNEGYEQEPVADGLLINGPWLQ